MVIKLENKLSQAIGIAVVVHKLAEDLAIRCNQVPSEDISEIPSIDYTPSRMAIQSHAY